MNETEPPEHLESESEADDSLADVSSHPPMKPRSAIPGAMLFCVNLALVATLFIAHFTLTGRGPASGRAPSVLPAPAGATATATATDAALPPDGTPLVAPTSTEAPAHVAGQPTATAVVSPPTSTPTPAIAPTPTPTSPPPLPPTANPGA